MRHDVIYMQENDPILLTAQGKGGRIELTETAVRVILDGGIKNWGLKKFREIPRDSISKPEILTALGNLFTFKSPEAGIRGVFNMFFTEEHVAEFEDLLAELSVNWYDDDTKLSYVATYDSAEKASREANRAAKKGWIPQGTSATDGHLNVGTTAAAVMLTGGLALLAGGSRSKGKITITYTRIPEWLEEHNKTVSKTSTQASAQDDVIVQLERLAKLKGQGLLTDEEFQVQKKKLLGT